MNRIAGQWTFPTGTMAPNSYLVIWCDPTRSGSTSFTTELNTGLRLNGEGGGVFLFDRNGQLVSQVEFGFQVANQTIGRVGNDWRLLAQPTPVTANSVAADLGAGNRLRINEWMANPRFGDDWFEIYNAETRPVQLSGFHVTDDPSEAGRNKFTIGPLSFIGGEGWVRFIADSNPRLAPNHVNFALDAEGESLRIYDASLQDVDTVDFGRQDEGVSQGWLPDGSLNLTSFPASASPAESNYLPRPDVVINEVFRYAGSAMEQAIELYNAGSQPVNIGGWYLSDDGARLKKYRIQDGTIIDPRSFMVFYEQAFNAGPGNTNNFRLVPFRFSPARGGSAHLSSVDRSG